VTQPNGTKPTAPTPEAALAEFAYANYPQIAQQLGAINILLNLIPLEALLAACKRHQSTSVLTLPANVPAEQAHAIATALRGDEKVITAALNLARVVAAVAGGGA
jgi:hypothetical protein